MKLTPAETWMHQFGNTEMPAIELDGLKTQSPRVSIVNAEEIRQIQADALRFAASQFAREFNAFLSNSKEIKTIHGQTVGHESYRLDFTGLSVDPVHTAIIEVQLLANHLHPIPTELTPACMQPCPDGSARTCDKPNGHSGDHWTYGGNTKTWANQLHQLPEGKGEHWKQHPGTDGYVPEAKPQ